MGSISSRTYRNPVWLSHFRDSGFCPLTPGYPHSILRASMAGVIFSRTCDGTRLGVVFNSGTKLRPFTLPLLPAPRCPTRSERGYLLTMRAGRFAFQNVTALPLILCYSSI